MKIFFNYQLFEKNDLFFLSKYLKNLILILFTINFEPMIKRYVKIKISNIVLQEP